MLLFFSELETNYFRIHESLEIWTPNIMFGKSDQTEILPFVGKNKDDYEIWRNLKNDNSSLNQQFIVILNCMITHLMIMSVIWILELQNIHQNSSTWAKSRFLQMIPNYNHSKEKNPLKIVTYHLNFQ